MKTFAFAFRETFELSLFCSTLLVRHYLFVWNTRSNNCNQTKKNRYRKSEWISAASLFYFNAKSTRAFIHIQTFFFVFFSGYETHLVPPYGIYGEQNGKESEKKTLCLEIAAAQQRTFARKSIQMYGIHIGPWCNRAASNRYINKYLYLSQNLFILWLFFFSLPFAFYHSSWQWASFTFHYLNFSSAYTHRT